MYIGHGISLCLAFCHVRSFGRGTPTGTQTISTKRLNRGYGFPAVDAYIAEIMLYIRNLFAKDFNDYVENKTELSKTHSDIK